MFQTIIVEDNMYIQKHLENMLSAEEDFCITACVSDALEAEKLCQKQKTDLVLMDVQTLHNHSGLAVGERLRAAENNIKVVIVTSLIDPEVLERAKSGCADSLWYKDYSDRELMEVIRRTMKGEQIFPDASPDIELNNMHSAQISPRQFDILRYFVKGLTYAEIAEKLGISKNGVRWNLDQIIEKGGFQNKHELLAALIEKKLIVTTLKEE